MENFTREEYNIEVIEKNDLLIYKKSYYEAYITLNEAEKIFNQKPDSLIYIVNDNNYLEGIISLGNVCRNINIKNKWMQPSFKYIDENDDEKQKILDVIKNNNSISNVPVLNNKREIVKEYRCIQSVSKFQYEQRNINNFLRNEIIGISDWLMSRGIKTIVILNIRQGNVLKVLKKFLLEQSKFEVLFVSNIHDFLRKKKKKVDLFIECNIDLFKKNRISCLKNNFNYYNLYLLINEYKIYCKNLKKWENISLNKKISFKKAFKQIIGNGFVFYNLTKDELKIVEDIQEETEEVLCHILCSSIFLSKKVPSMELECFMQRMGDNYIVCGGACPINMKNSINGIDDKINIHYVNFNWFISILENLMLVGENEMIYLMNQLSQLGVKSLLYRIPNAEELNLNNEEIKRSKNVVQLSDMISAADLCFLKDFFGELYSDEYANAMNYDVDILNKGGIKTLADYSDDFRTTVSGRRITLDQPLEAKNTIWVLGPCTVYGHYVENKHTIPSLIQKKLNLENSDIKYKVENCGISSMNLYDISLFIKNNKFKVNDIIILYISMYSESAEIYLNSNVKFYDTTPIFMRPHNLGNWFTDLPEHMNYRANMAVADFMLHNIKEEVKNENSNNTNNHVVYLEDKTVSEDYKKNIYSYLQPLIIQQKQYLQDYVYGCIVMNCNPFTNGHKYLVEYAAEQVDYLYIFVVQEDKSFFSFKERFELVKRGTEHIANVIVVQSGEFIISTVTFPGYFNKENKDNIKFDAAKDIEIFTDYIAPELHIKKRFVGEEPFDEVTRYYNQALKVALPEKGVHLIEIPRKENENKPISASLVRKYLKENNYSEIKKLVPETTYSYLEQSFSK